MIRWGFYNLIFWRKHEVTKGDSVISLWLSRTPICSYLFQTGKHAASVYPKTIVLVKARRCSQFWSVSTNTSIGASPYMTLSNKIYTVSKTSHWLHHFWCQPVRPSRSWFSVVPLIYRSWRRPWQPRLGAHGSFIKRRLDSKGELVPNIFPGKAVRSMIPTSMFLLCVAVSVKVTIILSIIAPVDGFRIPYVMLLSPQPYDLTSHAFPSGSSAYFTFH